MSESKKCYNPKCKGLGQYTFKMKVNTPAGISEVEGKFCHKHFIIGLDDVVSLTKLYKKGKIK